MAYVWCRWQEISRTRGGRVKCSTLPNTRVPTTLLGLFFSSRRRRAPMVHTGNNRFAFRCDRTLARVRVCDLKSLVVQTVEMRPAVQQHVLAGKRLHTVHPFPFSFRSSYYFVHSTPRHTFTFVFYRVSPSLLPPPSQIFSLPALPPPSPLPPPRHTRGQNATQRNATRHNAT